MKRKQPAVKWRTCVRSVLFVLFAVILGTASAVAGSWADIQTFEDVLARGLAMSDSLQGSRLQTLQAELGLTEVRAALKPQVLFNAEHNRQSAALNPMSALQGWQSDDVIWDSQVSVTIVQQLGANPQLSGGLAQAQTGLTLAQIQTEQAFRETLMSVQESYFAVLQAYHGWQVAKEAYANSRENLAVVRAKYEQGTATELDRMREHNAVYQSESQWRLAEGGLAMAATRLQQLLELEDWSQEQLAPWAEQHLKYWLELSEPWLPDFDDAWQYAQQHRSDLRSVDKQVRMAEIQHQTAQAERDWTLSLTGTYLWDNWVLNGSINSDQTLLATAARRWQAESDGSLLEGFLPGGPWQELDPEDIPSWMQDWLDGWQSPESSTRQDDSNPWQVGVTFQYRFGDGGASAAAEERLGHAVTESLLQRRQAREMIYLDVLQRHQQLQQEYRAWVSALDYHEEAKAMWMSLQETASRGLLSVREAEEADLLLKQSEQQLLQRRLVYEQTMAGFAAALGIEGDKMFEAMTGGNWIDLL